MRSRDKGGFIAGQIERGASDILRLADPALLGAAKAVHIVTPTSTVRRLVNMTALTVVDAGAERGHLALQF